MSKLKIALSKGSLLEPVIDRLEAAGLDTALLREPGRRLRLETADAEYVIARAADVPTFVEWGAVDIGFVGSDILVEGDFGVFELLDLDIGRCQFVLAGRREDTEEMGTPRGLTGAMGTPRGSVGSVGVPVSDPMGVPDNPLRVATKYPRTAGEYLARRGRQAEIIKLYGSMELAPLVGLADQIIDLKSTGRTLAENGLVVIEEIGPVSCRLIANYVSYKLKSVTINKLVEQVRAGLEVNL